MAIATVATVGAVNSLVKGRNTNAPRVTKGGQGCCNNIVCCSKGVKQKSSNKRIIYQISNDGAGVLGPERSCKIWQTLKSICCCTSKEVKQQQNITARMQYLEAMKGINTMATFVMMQKYAETWDSDRGLTKSLREQEADEFAAEVEKIYEAIKETDFYKALPDEEANDYLNMTGQVMFEFFSRSPKITPQGSRASRENSQESIGELVPPITPPKFSLDGGSRRSYDLREMPQSAQEESSSKKTLQPRAAEERFSFKEFLHEPPQRETPSFPENMSARDRFLASVQKEGSRKKRKGVGPVQKEKALEKKEIETPSRELPPPAEMIKKKRPHDINEEFSEESVSENSTETLFEMQRTKTRSSHTHQEKEEITFLLPKGLQSIIKANEGLTPKQYLEFYEALMSNKIKVVKKKKSVSKLTAVASATIDAPLPTQATPTVVQAEEEVQV